MSSEEKLDQILSDLELIKNNLKIVPNKESKIIDKKSSISEYETFAKMELKLNEKTITNHLSAISKFLVHSDGNITKDSVKLYLDSNDSDSWKSNQLKALRRYTRDFLKLGNWINEFEFTKSKAKIKHIPNDEELLEFFENISNDQVRLLFLILHNSGLRIGEVLQISVKNINFETNMIDVSNVHSGSTKSSWISFVTQQTITQITQYIKTMNLQNDSSLFSISERTAQQNFKNTSDYTDIMLNPHLLRTVFTEKCTIAKIPDKHINAFCGRVSEGMISKHYTDYSPSKLKEQYNKVEPYLTFTANNQ